MHPPITTRADLINALRVAAELEHGLMAQYLFAVYSMKRYQYEDLDPVQLEHVRRWSSSITLIARQEMEHLGLALNLLSAIGGTPSFSRPNMPQRRDYYGDAGIKLTLTRGDLATIKRFQHFEAPNKLLHKSHGGVIDQHDAIDWCQHKDPSITSRAQLTAMLGHRKALNVDASAPVLDFKWQSVQDLYQTIRDGFDYLDGAIGKSNLFVGKPSLQIFGGPQSPQYGSMNDLNQYGLDLIAVSDLATARQAISMILEQGEGVPANPQYLRWTHFCLFTEIRKDMEALDLGATAARPVVPNPMTFLHPDVCPDDEVTVLKDPVTIEVAKLFNGSYELMLLLLLYLYSDNVRTQDDVNGLMDAAFFPLMTMFVRPLAEILTELPSGVTTKDGLTNAGPGFELNGDVLLFPSLWATWDLFQERFDALARGFAELLANGDPWIDLPGQREEHFKTSRIRRRLEYIRANMDRLRADWRAKWLNIGVTE
jgi:Ferritin-like